MLQNGPPPYSQRSGSSYRLIYSYLEETAANIRFQATPLRDKWSVWDNRCTMARGPARRKRSFYRRIYPALLNHRIDIQRLDIPAWFLSGRYDFLNAGDLIEKAFNALKSPEKRLFWFEHSGHQLVRQEPKKCGDLLHQRLKAAARF
ncbi:MAG: hypothetical protein U5R06_24585 [candidate division KSB1 bacterium]|nr:hypothetical protein [candidate division KSB1 bacterium]